MDKHALRTLMKQKLQDASNLPDWDQLHLQLSKNLAQLVSKLNSEKFENGLSLGVYSPMRLEPVWWHSLSAESVAEYLLVHMHDEVKLSYHQVDFETLTSNEHGLQLADHLISEDKIPDVLLIPGLAFTKEGERLGRGKAYFDTFLKDFKGERIGLFFSFQQADNVFSEAHDEKLDYIVTDKDILIRGK